MGVSVVLLTRNCERHLRACLESVRWADEIVALDDDSRDGTRALLAAYAAAIHPQPADLIRRHRGNFDVARNVGFERARHEWILVVDSDEEVGPALRDEIRGAVATGRRVAYLVPRVNLFWGRASRVLGADFQLRLFPRGSARYEGDALDARPVATCPVERLEQPLLHRQADSPIHVLAKLWQRTTVRAQSLASDPAAKREPVWPLFRHTFRYYYRHMGAAEEGALGLFLSLVYAAHPALTQAKLRRLDARRRDPAGEAARP